MGTVFSVVVASMFSVPAVAAPGPGGAALSLGGAASIDTATFDGRVISPRLVNRIAAAEGVSVASYAVCKQGERSFGTVDDCLSITVGDDFENVTYQLTAESCVATAAEVCFGGYYVDIRVENIFEGTSGSFEHTQYWDIRTAEELPGGGVRSSLQNVTATYQQAEIGTWGHWIETIAYDSEGVEVLYESTGVYPDAADSLLTCQESAQAVVGSWAQYHGVDGWDLASNLCTYMGSIEYAGMDSWLSPWVDECELLFTASPAAMKNEIVTEKIGAALFGIITEELCEKAEEECVDAVYVIEHLGSSYIVEMECDYGEGGCECDPAHIAEGSL